MGDKPVKKGSPPWMATFADLCTLLLTFFVLLLTFASMDVQKFKDMLGSVKNAFGVQYNVTGEYQPVKMSDQAKQSQPIMPSTAASSIRPDDSRQAAEAKRLAKQVAAAVKQAGFGQAVDISSGRRGMRMRIKGNMLFSPGQARIKSGATKLLDKVAQVMRKRSFYLTVEGHTDDQPIRTAQFPSNWELSAARASSVLRYLLSRGVSKSKVSAVGYADNFPLADNTTEEGRLSNRRVEFVFTKHPLRAGVE